MRIVFPVFSSGAVSSIIYSDSGGSELNIRNYRRFVREPPVYRSVQHSGGNDFPSSERVQQRFAGHMQHSIVETELKMKITIQVVSLPKDHAWR
jgi:hypothetical protein